jgi:hypothetical protein
MRVLLNIKVNIMIITMSMASDYVSELQPAQDYCSSPRWYMSIKNHGEISTL